MTPEFVAEVLAVVAQIPPGRVTTYGSIAAALGQAGPRQVGQVLANSAESVPWWRVVRADGSLPEHLSAAALVHYQNEGIEFSSRAKLGDYFWDAAGAI